MLNQETISSMLPNATVVTYDVTDSTNTRAIELAETVEGNILVAAEEQTNGKGRQGKSFYSLPKAAYISQLLFVLRAI